MIFLQISKENILAEVTKEIKSARSEILATMMLSEELESPLPESYERLIINKVEEGVLFNRLGFGSQDEYNKLASRFSYAAGYTFKYKKDLADYQRMICIDGKKVFLGVDGVYLVSEFKPLVDAFKLYFKERF